MEEHAQVMLCAPLSAPLPTGSKHKSGFRNELPSTRMSHCKASDFDPLPPPPSAAPWPSPSPSIPTSFFPVATKCTTLEPIRVTAAQCHALGKDNDCMTASVHVAERLVQAPQTETHTNNNHNNNGVDAPNTRFARGIHATLELYHQPVEFLYCFEIMVAVLSEFSRLIPEETVSEMVYYVSLFNNVLSQSQHSPSPKQYLEQPRIYRQMEYFTSILWRMIEATHIIYYPHAHFPQPPVQILDEDAYEFWKINLPTHSKGIIMDCDVFIAAVKAHFEQFDHGIKVDESMRQEILSFVDPADCGVVTIFKFISFTNFFRPFIDSLQNMHQFSNCLWFRNFVSYEEAQQILAAHPKGSLLLHFPTPFPCPLALSLDPAANTPPVLIDRYSPMLLSVEGIRQRWCKEVRLSCEINFSWNRAFFGLMTFEEAEELLGMQPVGTYLLRLSHSSPGWFVIAYVSTNRKVLQLKVAVKPNGFESGKKTLCDAE